MKHIVKFLILLALAVAVAGFSVFNSGSVILLVHGYQVEFSLNFLILIWLLSFVVIYYFIRFYVNLRRLPIRLQRSRVKNALAASRKHLNAAGLHYFEGKYRSCYENSMKSIKREFNSENKILAYLLAFRAASVMRDSEKEATVLNELNQFSDSKWQLAKNMVLAENLYNEQKYGQCLDNLNSVLRIDHKHIPARRIMLKVYLNLNNYTKSYEVLEWLLKNDSLREYKAGKYKLRVISGLFNEVSSSKELNKFYSKLEHSEQMSFIYAKLYLTALIRLNEFTLVVEFLQQHQKNNSVQLVYSDVILTLSKKELDSTIIEKLLLIGENFLAIESNNANLLLALGILSYKKNDLSRAQSYLEASNNLKSSVDSCLYLTLVAKRGQNTTLLETSQNELLTNLHRNS